MDQLDTVAMGSHYTQICIKEQDIQDAPQGMVWRKKLFSFGLEILDFPDEKKYF